MAEHFKRQINSRRNQISELRFEKYDMAGSDIAPPVKTIKGAAMVNYIFGSTVLKGRLSQQLNFQCQIAAVLTI